MKNWEKFKEIFGFEPDINCILPRDICNSFIPKNPEFKCNECKLNDWWRREYNEYDKKEKKDDFNKLSNISIPWNGKNIL